MKRYLIIYILINFITINIYAGRNIPLYPEQEKKHWEVISKINDIRVIYNIGEEMNFPANCIGFALGNLALRNANGGRLENVFTSSTIYTNKIQSMEVMISVTGGMPFVTDNLYFKVKQDSDWRQYESSFFCLGVTCGYSTILMEYLDSKIELFYGVATFILLCYQNSITNQSDWMAKLIPTLAKCVYLEDFRCNVSAGPAIGVRVNFPRIMINGFIYPNLYAIGSGIFSLISKVPIGEDHYQNAWRQILSHCDEMLFFIYLSIDIKF